MQVRGAQSALEVESALRVRLAAELATAREAGAAAAEREREATAALAKAQVGLFAIWPKKFSPKVILLHSGQQPFFIVR